MRKASVVALIIALGGLASVRQAAANGNMGDVGAHMRQMEETCEAQRRGEYPRYHNACPYWDTEKPVQR